MTKTEQNRILAWRLKLLQQASVMPKASLSVQEKRMRR